MKAKWIVPLLAAALLLVAMAALAAEVAKKAAAPDTQKKVVRVVVSDDGRGDDDGSGEMGDDDGDDFAWMGVGDDGPGGGDHRIVIRNRMGRGGWRGFEPEVMHGSGPGMGGRGMARAFASLDLSDEQRQKMAAVHEKVARRNVQARADLQLARMDLHGLMKAERPDPGAIYTQIDKIARMRADMAKSHVGAFLEARALLTPEQQKQLRERHEGGPGMGHGPGAMRGMRGMHGMHGMPEKPGGESQ